MKSLTFRDRFRDRLGLIPKGGEISIEDSRPIQKAEIPKTKSHQIMFSVDLTQHMSLSDKHANRKDEGDFLLTSSKFTRKNGKNFDPYAVQTDFSPVYSKRIERRGKTEIFLPKFQKRTLRIVKNLPKVMEGFKKKFDAANGLKLSGMEESQGFIHKLNRL